MSASVTAPRRVPAGGLLSLLASTDHKSIARRLIGVSVVFFLTGGVLALLMRTELAQPRLKVVSESTYNQLFTMHGSVMIYLFMTPIGLALGLFLVPLQVGAREIAGPRWALAGLWLDLTGGLIMLSGFLTVGGPAAATWIGVDPLSRSANTPGTGMDMWVLGVAIVTTGQLIIAACVLVTALRRRTPDMTLLRMPVFTWTMIATCLMVIFAFPVLIFAMTQLWIERRYGVQIVNPQVYQQLFWFYGHPVVYVMFFPFVGAVGEVFATFAARRFFGYRFFVVSILAFAGLSMNVWAHHLFTSGDIPDKYFALTSTMLVIPAGIEYFDLIATIWGGRIRWHAAFLFALGFLLQFLVGGLTGIWIGSPTLDFHVNNSYFIVAHFHYTLFGGSAFGLFAGVYYWWPKITGHYLSDRLGVIHFWLWIVGFNVTFLPMFWLGWEGMTRRIATYPDKPGWATVNLIETCGAFVIALGMVVFLVNVALSSLQRATAPDDAWAGGQTLEWATTSPPPRHNFDAIPPVRSYAPLWDLRAEAAGVARE